MIGLSLAFSITLLLGGVFSPVEAEAQQAAKVARIGFRAAWPLIPTCPRPSVKDCVTLVTSRAATS